MRRASCLIGLPLSGLRRFFGARTSQFTPVRAVRPVAPSALALTEPYHARVEYMPGVSTRRSNPSSHTFEDAGLYYSLGATAEEVGAAFPTGFAGALGTEFDITGRHSLLVRPLGVSMVAQMEHWRQVEGRALAASGQPVRDLDASQPYAPQPLAVPPTRAQALGLRPPPTGSTASSSSSSEDGSSGRTLPVHPVRVLVGQRGIGKSGLLNYVVHYARLNQWLTVVVPDGFTIAHRGKVMSPSRLRLGSFDQNDMALDLLRAVLRSNGSRLQQVPQRGRYASYRYLPSALDAVVSKEREALHARESTEVATLKAKLDAEGKPWDPSLFKSKYEDETEVGRDRAGFTLHDMVAWGMRHPSAATDTVVALLEELRSVTEFPVLVAVDGANHLYEQGPHAWAGESVPPQSLSLQRALHCLGPEGFNAATHSMRRGLWLCAVSHQHTQDMGPMFAAAKVKMGYRIPVPRLSRQELFAQLTHYRECGNLFMLQGEREDGLQGNKRGQPSTHTALAASHPPHSDPPPPLHPAQTRPRLTPSQ